MEVPVSQAKTRLTELVRRVEEGEEVILTRHGAAVARIVPLRPPVDVDARRALLEALSGAATERALPGTPAGASQDFLYDEDGLPR